VNQPPVASHPCNQPGTAQEPATPLPGRTAAECLRAPGWEMGGSCVVALVEGGPTGPLLPSEGLYHRGPAVKPHTAQLLNFFILGMVTLETKSRLLLVLSRVCVAMAGLTCDALMNQCSTEPQTPTGAGEAA